MRRHWELTRSAAIVFSLAACLAWVSQSAGQTKGLVAHYKVRPGTTQGNLTVFPVVASTSADTSMFLTLDEGIRSGQVAVTEISQSSGLVRPRRPDGIVWPGRPVPVPPRSGARVNELALTNNSGRPLLLLAGEIVTGGKQDRVVSKDRIIPAHSEPVSLGVFCVEPHRWTEVSVQFGALHSSMAQPSVRLRAMADQDQHAVWNEVAKSRAAFVAGTVGAESVAMQSTSSYAAAVQNNAVKRQIDSVAGPIQESYDKLFRQLRSEQAVGAVVAVNGEIIWADVFASPSLLEKYWPKLIRSYAAEALAPRVKPTANLSPATQEQAQEFLDRMDAKRENVETEPGVYRNTQLMSSDFDAFILTALLPNTGFNVHVAKMKH